MKKVSKKSLLLVSVVVGTLATGCESELYHDYEFDNYPVTISTDDNKWFGLNQGIRIVTKGKDILLDYDYEENDDGSINLILHIGEKKEDKKHE